MALRTSVLKGIQVVESGRHLPLTLYLHVGHAIIPIERLAESPENVRSCLYDVMEYKDVKLTFKCETAEAARFYWIHTRDADEEADNEGYVLSGVTGEHVLYQYRDGATYPWRCGLYHFELHYQGKTYFGAVAIKPKNVSDRQMAQIHQVINQELRGLVLDYYHFKRTIGHFNQDGTERHRRFIRWYRENEAKLLRAIRDIETRCMLQIEKAYKLEDVPRHMDNRSLRLQHSYRGVIYQGTKFYNRHWQTNWDNDENRLAKYVISQIAHELMQSLRSLKVLEREAGEINDSYSNVPQFPEKIERHTIRIQTSEDENQGWDDPALDSSGYRRWQALPFAAIPSDQTEATKHLLKLSARLNTPFWNRVENRRPKTFRLGTGTPSYRLLYELWKEAASQTRETDDTLSDMPAYKPTSVLYEYYVLFGVLRALRELDFLPDREAITIQLQKSFFRDGLKEGTKVSFVNGDCKIVVTYDETLAPNSQSALQNRTHFYGHLRRKPDIRIDLYKNSTYVSTFIIEVKYRPFYNIHSDFVWTKTMEQMNEYRLISYVQKNSDGQKEYNLRAVYQVVCAYPGDDDQPIVTHADCGTFLQYYPNENTDDPNDIVGFPELREMIRKWIDL